MMISALHLVVSSYWDKLSRKTFIIVSSKTLGLYFNNLICDGMYCRHNTENFLQRIQMQLSEKPKTFFQCFSAFVDSISNFQHFEIKDEPDSLKISEIIDSERRGYLIVEKYSFRTPFGSPRVKGSQALLKSAPQNFYLIVSSFWDKLS